MSSSKLQKYLDRPAPSVSGTHSIVLSDSKGSYIQQYLGHSNFTLIHRGGARLGDQLYWVKKFLKVYTKHNKQVTLYIWLGTCDITYKLPHSRAIALRHSSHLQCLEYFRRQISIYQAVLANFPTVKVVWLDIPPYSVSLWNSSKGGVLPGDREADQILSQRIALVNDIFRSVNHESGVSSFRFRADLLRTRKVAGKQSRSSVNFSLFKDGIHPGPTLGAICDRRMLSVNMFSVEITKMEMPRLEQQLWGRLSRVR